MNIFKTISDSLEKKEDIDEIIQKSKNNYKNENKEEEFKKEEGNDNLNQKNNIVVEVEQKENKGI
jgi:hypothetical protein